MKNCLGNPAWKIGLFKYLCTPLSDSIPSPYLLDNRVYNCTAFSQTFIKLILGNKSHSDRQPDLHKRE